MLLTVGILLAVLELRGRLPGPASIGTALTAAAPGWLVVAAALQLVSMAAFAEQQRHLLAAFGVRMTPAASVAVSYASSAMATALPGGSAVSAGYAFRQYRARGASRTVAAAVMLLSGVASVAGLALLYAGDALAWAAPSRISLAWTSPFWPVLGLAVAAVAGIVAGLRAIRPTQGPSTLGRPETLGRSKTLDRLRRTLHETATLAATVPVRRWAAVIGLAALNWLTDLACLLASVHAVGPAVPVRSVATAYLVAQLVRHIPLTPGGIGIVEAGLIVALTTAGAAAAPAAAAVLLYRLFSCWVILPIGLICWTVQRPARRDPQHGRHPSGPVPVPAAQQRDERRHEQGADHDRVDQDPGAETGGQDLDVELRT